eukprot:4776736-Alexandrium_andersonii.AAC.1
MTSHQQKTREDFNKEGLQTLLGKMIDLADEAVPFFKGAIKTTLSAGSSLANSESLATMDDLAELKVAESGLIDRNDLKARLAKASDAQSQSACDVHVGLAQCYIELKRLAEQADPKKMTHEEWE